MKQVLNTSLILVLVLVLAALALTSSVVANQNNQNQIAYVDMYYLFENHPWQQEAEFRFEDEAVRIKEELEARGVDMSEVEREEMLREYEDYLTNLERSLINEIIENINQNIETIAASEEVLLVVDKSAVAYGGRDLTDAVLAEIKDTVKESETIEEMEDELEELQEAEVEEDNLQ